MSVTFGVARVNGVRSTEDLPEINLCNDNASDLLRWLGLPDELLSEHPARDLAARCRRRMWPIQRNIDPPRKEYADGGDGQALLIRAGRREGYLRHQVERLLQVAQVAGEGMVSWG